MGCFLFGGRDERRRRLRARAPHDGLGLCGARDMFDEPRPPVNSRADRLAESEEF